MSIWKKKFISLLTIVFCVVFVKSLFASLPPPTSPEVLLKDIIDTSVLIKIVLPTSVGRKKEKDKPREREVIFRENDMEIMTNTPYHEFNLESLLDFNPENTKEDP